MRQRRPIYARACADTGAHPSVYTDARAYADTDAHPSVYTDARVHSDARGVSVNGG